MKDDVACSEASQAIPISAECFNDATMLCRWASFWLRQRQSKHKTKAFARGSRFFTPLFIQLWEFSERIVWQPGSPSHEKEVDPPPNLFGTMKTEMDSSEFEEFLRNLINEWVMSLTVFLRSPSSNRNRADNTLTFLLFSPGPRTW